MSKKTFSDEIIGADTAASWAGASHIPALLTQPSLVPAAAAFGAELWFADPYADNDHPLWAASSPTPLNERTMPCA